MEYKVRIYAEGRLIPEDEVENIIICSAAIDRILKKVEYRLTIEENTSHTQS